MRKVFRDDCCYANILNTNGLIWFIVFTQLNLLCHLGRSLMSVEATTSFEATSVSRSGTVYTPAILLRSQKSLIIFRSCNLVSARVATGKRI